MKYIAMTSYLNNSSIYTEDGIVCHIPPEQPLLLDLRSCILGWRDSRRDYNKDCSGSVWSTTLEKRIFLKIYELEKQ